MNARDTIHPESNPSAERYPPLTAVNAKLHALQTRIPRLLNATPIGAVNTERLARLARRIDAYVETHQPTGAEATDEEADWMAAVAADTDRLIATVDAFIATPHDRSARVLETALNQVASPRPPHRSALPPVTAHAEPERPLPDGRAAPLGDRGLPDSPPTHSAQRHQRRPASQPDAVARTLRDGQWMQRQERRTILALGMGSIALGWLILSSLSQPFQAPRPEPGTESAAPPPSEELNREAGDPTDGSTEAATGPRFLSARQADLESRLQRIEALLAPMDEVKAAGASAERRDIPADTGEALTETGATAVDGVAAGAVAGAAVGAMARGLTGNGAESRPPPAPSHTAVPHTRTAPPPRAQVRPTARPAPKPTPAAEPRPVRRPETKPTPRPEVRATPKPNGRTEPQPSVLTARKPEPKAEPRPEIKPVPKPSPKPEARPEARPETKPAPRPEPKTAPPPKPKAAPPTETKRAAPPPTAKVPEGKPATKPSPPPAPPAPKKRPAADQDTLF